MKRLIIHAEAKAELDEAARWYDKQRLGLGRDLKAELKRTIRKVQHDPGIGARYRSSEFQFIRATRFPYVIYYIELADAVWIAAIAHDRRRPGYWRKRSRP